MKVIAVFGSPRSGGNSDILLNTIIDGIEANGITVEKIILRNLAFNPCISCGKCMKTGLCAVNDDMQKLYPRFAEANGVVVASPIYFMGVSAQLKAFIDRFQVFWARKYILHLPVREKGKIAKGFFVATAARTESEGLFAGAIKTVKSFFHVIDVEYAGDMLCSELEEKGAVYKKQALLKQAFDTGKTLFV
ncbi:MAG: flavodoxin family protein [Candidatus Kuenenia sp.]|nr:flavodoxin family protein [Candidatus Kuenenia hertensis]